MSNKVVLLTTVVLALIGVWHVIMMIMGVLSSKSSGFQTLPYNNLSTGNQNPLWYLGNAYAGAGGSVDLPTTPVQQALFDPTLRVGFRSQVKYVSPSGETTVYRGNGKCNYNEREEQERDAAGGTKYFCVMRNPALATASAHPGVESMVYNNLDSIVKPGKEKLPVPYNDSALKGINMNEYVTNNVKSKMP